MADIWSLAWKHACGYLEDYISATEKVHKTHAKEYEKILKVGLCVFIIYLVGENSYLSQSVSDPLKEGHHFDQNLGGIAGLFENIRTNTTVRTAGPPTILSLN